MTGRPDEGFGQRSRTVIHRRVPDDAHSKGQAESVKRGSSYVRNHQEESLEQVINTETLPRAAIMDAWSQNPWRNGTQIDELQEMQRIHVRTVYSHYEITVIDGGNGEILVKGGAYIPDLTEGQLTGAT